MNKRAAAVILANVPWDWSTDYINQTAFELSKTHEVICFFWYESRSVREYISGRYPVWKKLHPHVSAFYGIHAFPFRRFGLIQRLNLGMNVLFLRLLTLGISGALSNPAGLVWFFDPRLWPIARRFGSRYRTVYDCVDYYRGDARLTEGSRRSLIRLEEDAVRHADVMSVNSDVLFREFQPKRGDLLRVPQGFRLRTFSAAFRRRKARKGAPVVGYVGAVNDRIDYELLTRVASEMPDVRFLIAGPKVDLDDGAVYRKTRRMQQELFDMPNVVYLGTLPKHRIPEFLSQASVGIIPYRADDVFNRYSFPMKLFEYFYAGIPVVATPIRELERFTEYVHIKDSVPGWCGAIRYFLRKKRSRSDIRRMRALARSQRWELKISYVLRAVSSTGASFGHADEERLPFPSGGPAAF